MKITDIITEAANPAQQAAIAVSMKKAGKKPKQGVAEEVDTGQDDARRSTPKGVTTPEQEKAFRKKVQAYGDELEQRQRKKEQGVAESKELAEEFDLIESIVEMIAQHNGVDPEAVWEDLEALTEDELYVFAVTSDPLMEDWQKANKRDRTDGMSQKAVNAYRRENPGSKLKTAVTTKPSKLKKGGKASKRRKSYCSRSRVQMKMHSISCAKTPDKSICKARRRWNCCYETLSRSRSGVHSYCHCTSANGCDSPVCLFHSSTSHCTISSATWTVILASLPQSAETKRSTTTE